MLWRYLLAFALSILVLFAWGNYQARRQRELEEARGGPRAGEEEARPEGPGARDAPAARDKPAVDRRVDLRQPDESAEPEAPDDTKRERVLTVSWSAEGAIEKVQLAGRGDGPVLETTAGGVAPFDVSVETARDGNADAAFSEETAWTQGLVRDWRPVDDPQADGTSQWIHEAETESGVRVVRTVSVSTHHRLRRTQQLRVRLEFDNTSDVPAALRYRLFGPTRFRGEQGRGAEEGTDLRLAVGRTGGVPGDTVPGDTGGAERSRAPNGTRAIEVETSAPPEEGRWSARGRVSWVGALNAELMACLFFRDDALLQGRLPVAGLADATVDGDGRAVDLALESDVLRLEPGTRHRVSFGLYVGPRDPASLAPYRDLRFEAAGTMDVDLSERYRVEVDSGRGTVRAAYLRKYNEVAEGSDPYRLLGTPIDGPGTLDFELMFAAAAVGAPERTLELWRVPWVLEEVDVEEGQRGIRLSAECEGLRIIKEFYVPGPEDLLGHPLGDSAVDSLDPDLARDGPNHIRVVVRVENTSRREREFDYKLYGPAAIDTEHFRSPGADLEFSEGRWNRGVVLTSVYGPSHASEDGKEVEDVAWVGIENSYFAAIFFPPAAGAKPAFIDRGFVEQLPDPQRLEELAEEAGKSLDRLSSAEVGELASKAFPNLRAGYRVTGEILAPGESVSREFVLYLGPRDSRLNLYGDLSFSGLNDYGTFSGIVKFFIWLLGVLKSVALGSWGFAVILLTLIVKLCLHPIQRRSQKSLTRFQKKFQKIQPQVKELQERFKNDRMRLHQETQKLFKAHGVNPGQQMAGCLIIFLQLPIWFCLYSTLQYAIGLRQAPFLYIEDLTLPDRLLQLGVTLPFLGNYLNLLPVLYVILTVVNQRLQPRPQDPQMQAQYRMMTFMMLFFGFIFYKFPAGFMLYIMTSAALGIIESKIIKAQLAREDEAAGDSGGGALATAPAAQPAPYPQRAGAGRSSSASRDRSSGSPSRRSRRKRKRR